LQRQLLEQRPAPTLSIDGSRIEGRVPEVRPTPGLEEAPDQQPDRTLTAPLLTEIYEKGIVHSEARPDWDVRTLRLWHNAGIIHLWRYTTKTPAGHRLAWTAVFTNWEHT
jgi:hypothetical protein